MSEKWELPPVFERTYVFTGWLLDRVEGFPKSARFTFGQRLTDRALTVIECLTRAAYSRRTKDQLDRANTELEVIRVLVRLSKDRRYLSEKQYIYATGELLEIGKMVGGWLKQAKHG